MNSDIKIIYKEESCPFLKMTEIWFKNKNLYYEKYNADELSENVKNKINNFNGKYPKILINDKIIEGYADLIKQESYVLFLLGILKIDEK